MELKEEIKAAALIKGADLVGVATVDRFAEAPPGFHPTDIMPAARTVLVMACKIPDRLVCGCLPTALTNAYQTLHRRLDDIACSLAVLVERKGGQALPIPADDPYMFWDAENRRGMGDLSHKHAARAAGLGILGKNSLLITPQHGNRVHLVSVITDLDLEPDPLVEEDLCPPGCRLCLDACPSGALQDGQLVVQKLCREVIGKTLPKGYWVYNCWECRKVCPAGNKKTVRNVCS